MNHELDSDVRKHGKVENRAQCMELCMAEQDFDCRSVNAINADNAER